MEEFDEKDGLRYDPYAKTRTLEDDRGNEMKKVNYLCCYLFLRIYTCSDS